MTGGCNFAEETVSSLHVEVSLDASFVARKKNIPRPKFAHGATFCGAEIVITSGISDLMVNMGLRSVPIGEPECYSFNIFKNQWS